MGICQMGGFNHCICEHAKKHWSRLPLVILLFQKVFDATIPSLQRGRGLCFGLCEVWKQGCCLEGCWGHGGSPGRRLLVKLASFNWVQRKPSRADAVSPTPGMGGVKGAGKQKIISLLE